MSCRFSERDTEQYYDAEDSIYRTIWDRNGSVHWGFFDENTGEDFLKASANLNRFMAGKVCIDQRSNILDLGCGNGNTSIWLSREFGSQVTGIDLSSVRVDNANAERGRLESSLAKRLTFRKCSAMDLPFSDNSFSHVWSQSTIYHVPDKIRVLMEVNRVIEEGGLFIFDDLFKPKQDISYSSKRFLYDRLLFDTNFDFLSYQETLKEIGFQVQEALDISDHLKLSYQCLSKIAESQNDGSNDSFELLSKAYFESANAVDKGEIGWAMYVCKA